MAEIPEHLLARSKARRSALSGGGDGEAAAPTSTASTTAPTGSAVPAVAAASVAKAAKIVAPVPASAPKAPVIKGLAFAKSFRVLLMVGVPMWAFFYSGVFKVPVSTEETPEQIGASIYAAQCSACHGANGGGSEAGLGIGRPLWNGQAELTFLKAEQQIAFVRHGSCSKGVPYGNPKREGGEHKALVGMPAFPDLTPQQILYVIEYERSILSDKPYPEPEAGVAELTSEEIEAEEAKLDVTTEGVCGAGRKGY